MKSTLVVIIYCLLLAVDANIYAPNKRCNSWFCEPEYSRPKNTKTVECDSITKYDVDWFIMHALKAKKPAPSTCLFYTHGLSRKAKDYAKNKADPKLTTIWEVWPGGYYNKKFKTNNPLRCIMQKKDTERTIYFQNMSKAFASLCDVFATVMDSGITPETNSFDYVNKAGIWFNMEFPTLQRGYLKNLVYQIEAISEDGATRFNYWTRKNVQATSGELKKREAEPGVVDELYSDMQVLKDDDADLYPGWWEEEDALDDMDLEDWELDPE